MESLSLLRKYLSVLGILNISEKSSPHRLQSYNAKNTIICSLAGCNAVLYARLLYEPNTFEQYINVIYNCSSASVFTLIFIVMVWNTLELFKFIEKLQETAANRKCDRNERC